MYYLTGIIEITNGEEERHYFDSRKEVFRGKIEKGDEITLLHDFQDDENNGEIITELITLEAVSFENVIVPAGEFKAWKLDLVRPEEGWIVDDDFVVDLVHMENWFVPYLGIIKHENKIEAKYLESEEEMGIERAVFDTKTELVDYNIPDID